MAKYLIELDKTKCPFKVKVFQNCKRTAMALYLYSTPKVWSSLQCIAAGQTKKVDLRIKLSTNIPYTLRQHSQLDFFDVTIDEFGINQENHLWISLKNPSKCEMLERASNLMIKIIFLKTPQNILINSKKFRSQCFRKTCFCD